MTEVILFKMFSMVIVSFFVVILIMPYIKKIAVSINAVDIPKGRHIHDKVTPKLGGLGIFIGFLVGYMIFGTPSSVMNAVLIGSFIIIIVGVVDDICTLPPLPQFLAQLFAACVIVFYGKLLITNISAFGINIDFYFLSYPITIFFIVGCINCINLIDGLDGLSGGISSIYYLTVGIICAIKMKFGLDFVLTFVMLGSTLGFLAYNFYPASVFAGDAGSNFMGFIISVIALLGFKNVTLTSLLIPLLILGLPILDTLFAILRRLIKKQHITEGDASHLHHQLIHRNLSTSQAVSIIYIIDGLFASASIMYVIGDRKLGYIIYSLLVVIVLIIIFKTNIIFDHEKIKQTKHN